MNFDKSLRTAMPPVEEPSSLASVIDNRLGNYRSYRTLRRRVTYSLCATAAAIAAFILVPAISVQASLQKMIGALDGVETMICRRYTLGEGGKRTLAGSQIYDHGKWRLESQGGREVTLFVDGKRYLYEPFTRSYIVKSAEGPFDNQPAIKLSSLLEQMQGWGNDVVLDETVLNGKRVDRAVVTSQDLPERYILLADKTTGLPVKGFVDSGRGSKWTRVVEMDFEYPSQIPNVDFQPKAGVPLLSRDDWEDQVGRTMLSRDLGRYPLKKGELIFRSFDVAEDGSVFVAFQSNKRLSGWSGYCFDLDDGQGGRYVQTETGMSVDSPFARVRPRDGGRIEIAVFVPVEPLTRLPKRYTIKAHMTPEGELVRPLPMTIQYPDGRKESRMTPDPSTYSDVPVLIRTGGEANCADRPGYMVIESYGDWQSPLTSQLKKAAVRSRFYGNSKVAIPWLREQLRIMEAIEREGGGPYSKASTREAIEKLERLP